VFSENRTVLQVAVASEPAGAEGVQGSKDKRMPAPTVPAEVKQAVAIFKPYFDPDLFPRVSLHPLTAHHPNELAYLDLLWQAPPISPLVHLQR